MSETKGESMFSCKIILLMIVLFAVISSSVSAEELSLRDLQDLPSASKPVVDSSKAFNYDHWAYKSLVNIGKKYGLMLGSPGDKFDGQKPISRNEAAVILVNLNGKIEQDNIQLTESEKVQIDILKQELKKEITKLAGRIDNLEGSLTTLKGNVTALQSSDKKNWKYGFGENLKISGGMLALYNGSLQHGTDSATSPPDFSVPAIDLNVSGKLYPHINYVIQGFPTRRFDSPANGFLGDAYFSTDIIPHHTIQVGQTRVPIGYEGPQSPYYYETVQIAQIARKFSAYRDAGIKINGKWKYLDYNVGAYNGAGNNTPDSNTSMDMIGMFAFKPLANAPKYGYMEVAGGIQQGQASPMTSLAYSSAATTYRYARQTYSSYLRYKYKNFESITEYASRNGYGGQGIKADGLYSHFSYYVTPRTELLARYDRFNPNKATNRNHVTEYTLGGSYYLYKEYLRLMVNLVYVQDEMYKDSERVCIQTQYKF